MTDYRAYLSEIEIAGDLIIKIDRVIEFYQKILSDFKAEDIFVTDIISEDGAREYQNLWLLGPNIIAEAKRFNTSDDFDFVKYDREKILYWNLKKKNFDLESFNDESRLDISVSYRSNISLSFKAARNNCIYLMEIMKKYFL